MTNAMFVGWDYPKAGREKEAGEFFQTVTSFWKQQQKEGRIESFEPVILNQHGGNLNGFFLVRGEPARLDEVRRSDEFRKIQMKCGYLLEGFGVVQGFSGDDVYEVMGEWREIVS